MARPDPGGPLPGSTPNGRINVRGRWKSKITALAALLTLSAGAGVAGCSNKPQVSIDAGPTVVCGTVLADSAAAPVLFDATHHLPTIKHLTVGDVLMFRVARGCSQGAHVTWVPPSGLVWSRPPAPQTG